MLTYFQTIEVINGKELPKVAIIQRNCRFPTEPERSWQEWYNIGRCLAQMRVDHELKHCNCTLHTAPVICTFRFHLRMNG